MVQKIGPQYLGEGKCELRVWAPLLKEISLRLISDSEKVLPLVKDEYGFFSLSVDKVRPWDKYYYRLNNSLDRPDPVSHFQPEGVMGPSCIVDHSAFKWQDKNWHGLTTDKMIIYELHVGTFTKEGTFQGVISKLPHLRELGINAVEIMPVAQFPGVRNWGYDGVYPFAVQNSYGGPDGLKKLVNECHKLNISVILDVVYNHLGPEGNFHSEFMPCFTDKYKTPWGKAINFDDMHSAGVRNFFIQNALYWFEYYHIDALRLDAIHGIFDMSAKHILKELSEEVMEFSRLNGRKRYLIAESDLNDVRVIKPYSEGGYGLDAQWSDDFHHCLHTLLTKEKQGYYQDFGSLEQLVKAIKEGFVYSWEYSKYRKRYHGSSSADIPASRFVVFSQNHDQIGNRMKGERLTALVSFAALKVSAGSVLLSSNIPLLFMGEEFGEDAPFLYFVSFHDAQLIEAVREGRKREFASFEWPGEPDDPFNRNSFLKSKLQWNKLGEEKRGALLDFYKRLIQIRNDNPAVRLTDKETLKITFNEKDKILSMVREYEQVGIFIIVNFNKETAIVLSEIEGDWHKILDSSDTKWLGPGSKLPQTLNKGLKLAMAPLSLAVFQKKP